MVSITASPLRSRGFSPPVLSGPGHRPRDRPSPSDSGAAGACRLADYRRCRGLLHLPDETFDLIQGGWRGSTKERYERAWQSFKKFLRSAAVSLDSASVTEVLNYLRHLHDRKLSYSTINLHRSAISMTLAPVDGVPVGEHSLVKRLMKGAFTKHPPPRKVPAIWDPSKVLALFQDWPPPLSLSQLLRKTAFLISIITARRPSEVSALLCDPDHLHIDPDFL